MSAGEGDTPHDLPPADLPSRDLPWGLTGCNFAAFVISVPAAIVQPYVPEGFRVQSVAEVAIGGQTGLAIPDPAADGNFGIEGLQCESSIGLDGQEVPGLVYASYFAGVEPPALQRRDVANHFVKWQTLVPDADRRELLASYGLPVVDGTSHVSTTATPAGAAQVLGEFSMEGVGDFSFAAEAGLVLPKCSFIEFMATPNGLAEWGAQCRIRTGGGAVGTINVPAGSWAADIVGTGPVRAAGFAGIVDFYEGSIHLPAVPANATAP